MTVFNKYCHPTLRKWLSLKQIFGNFSSPFGKRRRKIAENFNRLSRLHERYRHVQTTARQTDSLPLTVRDPSMSLLLFCARLKTEMFCKAYD